MVPFVVDRYEIMSELAAGGEGTVYLGRLRGDGTFRKLVAVKRLHDHLARDPAALAPFRDEARIASRIHHPNVVETLDVLERGGRLFIVMEYVHGESLATLVRGLASKERKVPASIVAAIACDLLEGLHAAHEATDEQGAPLSVVHRDVSPHNVLVGADGVTRITDFGVAKATGRLAVTTDDRLKGKLGYMAPEQIAGSVDRRTDVFAASIVLWELLTGRRLFDDEEPARTMARVLAGDVPDVELPSAPARKLLETIRMGLEVSAEHRFATAHEMALAVRRVGPVATAYDVAEWLRDVLGAELDARAELAVSVERAPAPRSRRGAPISLGALGLGVVVAIVGVWTQRAKSDAPLSGASAAPSSSVAVSSTNADLSASTTPAATSAPLPVRSVASPPTTRRPVVPSATVTASCQKSWWDARGIRHFNPECNLD